MTILTEKSAQHINVYFAGKAKDFEDEREREFLDYLQQVITSKVARFEKSYNLQFHNLAYDENRDTGTTIAIPPANAINIVISDHLKNDDDQKGVDKYKSLPNSP